MQVSQSSAVRQSNSTGQAGPALSVDAKAFDTPSLDKGLMLSLACAEGNTNADGSLRYLGSSGDCPTGYPAKGHRDPGDGMWNKGRLSYAPERHGLPANTSAEECEKRAVDLVKTQMATLETKLQGLGMSPSNAHYRFVVANLMDSVNQTGTACFQGKNSLWNHLPQAIKEMNAGKDPLQAMVDCRVRSHANDDGSCGSFNGSWETTRGDQLRRAKEIFDCLQQHGGISGTSASPRPAPTPGTSSNSTFEPSTPPAAPPVHLGGTPPSGTAPGGTELLGRGAKGPQVSALQEGLNRAGASPALSVDGDFGPATEQALKAFQQRHGLRVDGVHGPESATQLTYARPANPTAPPAGGGLNPATLGGIGTGGTQALKEIKPGSTGPEVKRLKQALADAGFYKGEINDQMGPTGVDALKAAKVALKLGGPADVAGDFTLRKIEEYAARQKAGATRGTEGSPGAAPSTAVLGNGVSLNTQHPWLQKMATSRLNEGGDSTCVATTLGNMDRLGIPSFAGGTLDDPNNPRGAMVQMMKEGHWTSLPLPGSRPQTIHSPYGTVSAHVISADEYEKMAKAGQIPSGAVIFQTRHGWDYNLEPYGNDMGIVRDNGRETFNYRAMSPIIYSDAKDVVLLVPKDALRTQ